MSRVVTVARLGAVALGTATVVFTLPAAAADTATFTSTPASGPPGTSIVLTSRTPCRLPPGVSGQPFIRASLTRGSTVISAATIALSPSGSWTGTLSVGSQAAAGVDTIEAFCLAGPQAEGALLAYSPRTFTVTASGGLAGTGFDSWRPSVTAIVLLVAGGSLLLAAGRRTVTPVER
jgi:hypothetical protein